MCPELVDTVASKVAEPSDPKPAVETQPAKKGKAKAKKRANRKAKPEAKPRKKKEAKSAAKPKAKKTKKSRKPRPPKSGLNLTMVKCLKALAWYKREVTMAEIAKKAGLKDVTTVRTAIGSANPEISETIAKKYHKGSSCLLDNGMVRHVKHEDARATLYAITAKGLKAVKDI